MKIVVHVLSTPNVDFGQFQLVNVMVQTQTCGNVVLKKINVKKMKVELIMNVVFHIGAI